MITKQTVLSQIEIVPNGVIQIRLEKQIVDDGVIVARQYHRTGLEPGVALDAQMKEVNAHLVEMGYPPADSNTIDRVRRIVRVEHLPEVVAAFRSARDAAMAPAAAATKRT